MTGILICFSPCILVLLSIKHGPEDAEPFIEKTRNIGSRKKLRACRVQAGVNGFIKESILQPAAFVVTSTARAMLLNVGVGLENGLRALKHAIAKEILIDVCIELCTLVVILLRMSQGIMKMAGHGLHVGHVDVVRDPESLKMS